MKKIFIIMVAALMLASSQVNAQDTEVEVTGRAEDEAKILGLLDNYVKAFQDADTDLLKSLVWLDDERFTEIEDMVPMPFGKKTFLALSEWIRANAKPGTREMVFHDPHVFFLADNVAYLVAIQDIETPDWEGKSRVTLILLKKDEEWKIIHGHFSPMPEPE